MVTNCVLYVSVGDAEKKWNRQTCVCILYMYNAHINVKD